MAIKPWFPTFIYDARLGGAGSAALRRALLEDSYKVRDHDRAGQRWCRKNYPGGYTSYASLDHLHRTFSTFMDLEKKIRPHVLRFARRLDMNLQEGKLQMTDCWVSVMSRQATHSLHLHPLSVISGAFYLAAPRGCARLRFEDPRLDKTMAAPPKQTDCRPENRQQILYDAEPGRLILFESWLRHEVAPNPTRGDRVSVSFNYDWV
jgi:uncharacterized protein (TIGR02466 family)